MLQRRAKQICCLGISILWSHFVLVARAESSIRQDAQVSVESNTARMETIYKISAGTCQITWTLYHSKVNEGAIRNESICSHSSLHQQTQLVSKILAKVLNDSGTPPKFNTLVFGTLASSPEMSARLAVLAKQSGG